MSESATYSTKHPHEPEIPPALDADGRCLVCGLYVRATEAELELANERTRHHSLRWLLGLDTHAGEEQQSRELSHKNLSALLDER